LFLNKIKIDLKTTNLKICGFLFLYIEIKTKE